MIKKYVVKYILECETGLQIQAGNISFDIGGIDNPVVKNPITGEPYIPGSSLKGKMRSLLEWQEAPDELIRRGGQVLNDPKYDVCKLFGVAPSAEGSNWTSTRRSLTAASKKFSPPFTLSWCCS